MAGCSSARSLYLSSGGDFKGANASNLLAHVMNANTTSTEKLDQLKYVTYGILTPVIILLGFVGNITNLVVLTRPNIKGATFLYLTWIAISDLMSLLFAASVGIGFKGKKSTSYSASFYYSHLQLPLRNYFMACGVFIVIALTVERYFSVCLPARFKEIHNIKCAKRFIAAAYISAFIVYLPLCFRKAPMVVPSSNGTQYVSCENPFVASTPCFKAYSILKEVLVRLGPAVVLAVLNLLIIIAFRKKFKKRKYIRSMSVIRPVNNTEKESQRKYDGEKRLINLLVGIVVIFITTNTPGAIYRILNSDRRHSDFGFQVFRAVVNILELSNCAMNFYFYFICSPMIRRTFISFLTCSIPEAINFSRSSSKLSKLSKLSKEDNNAV